MAYDLQDFNEEVIKQSDQIPVVLDFWAEWCGPCRMLSPVLEKLADQSGEKWKLVKINTEEYPQIAAQFQIRSIPAVKMVYQKQIVAEFVGAQPEHQIKKWLKENLPESEEEKDTAESLTALLAEGKRDEARDMVASALQQDSGNHDLRAKLAVLYLPKELSKAEEVFKPLAEEPKYEIEHQSIEMIQHLKRIVDEGEELADTNENLIKEYKDGAQLLFNEKYESALEHFLDCMIKGRQMDNDGPRKACIAIFTILGDSHPITQKYRRRFSMALY